ncbi:MAG TPA: hypothetical protein VGT79_08185, partial [Xanthomonadaceae bacterium]|nr:hypothetical protein [Xanthomonadaceae bacterium]
RGEQRDVHDLCIGRRASAMSKGPLTRAERKKNLERVKTLDVRVAYAAKTTAEPAPAIVKRGKKNGEYTLRPTKRGDER